MQIVAAAGEGLAALQHGWLLALAGLGFMGVASLQIGLAYVILTHLRRLDDRQARLDRLIEGVGLLTDATDAGLTAILRRLQAPAGGASAPARVGRPAAVRRRVVAAARRGQPVDRIAQAEALSESEVRLHLSLAGVPPEAAAPDQAAT